MKNRDSKRKESLESLEKLRESELDHAQFVHAQKVAVATEKESALTNVRDALEGSREMARALTSDECVISVDALTRLRHFSAIQADELKNAERVFEQSQREVDDARALILAKYVDLTVLDRLRERRATQENRETSRVEQRQLDDQALIRLSDRDDSQK